jgi:hypothetical protein
MADAGGTVSLVGASYRTGRAWARSCVEVAIVGGSVQLSVDGKVIRVHAIRHDRAKEHGDYATPKAAPHTEERMSVRGVRQVPEPMCRTRAGPWVSSSRPCNR